MVVAYIGYESVRRALVESIRSQLSGLCQVKSTSIQNQLRTIKGLVVSLSADETFLHALKDFKKGFDELNEQAIVSSQSSDISVTALEDLEVLVLDPETLNVLIDEMPRLARDRRPDGHPAQGRPVGPEARRPGSLNPAPGCFWSEPVRAPRCPRSRQRAAPAHSNDWRSGGEDATGWCGVPPKEGLLPAVPPLRDAVRETRDDDTGQSGHDRRLSAAEMPVKNYVCCPRNS